MPNEEPDEFLTALDGIAKEVLAELRGAEVSEDPAARRAFVEAMGHALKKRDLKIAHLNVIQREVHG